MTLFLTKDFWEANGKFFGVVSAREITVLKRAGKAALTASTRVAESCSRSCDMFVADLDESDDGGFSAKAALSRSFA